MFAPLLQAASVMEIKLKLQKERAASSFSGHLCKQKSSPSSR